MDIDFIKASLVDKPDLLPEINNVDTVDKLFDFLNKYKNIILDGAVKNNIRTKFLVIYPINYMVSFPTISDNYQDRNYLHTFIEKVLTKKSFKKFINELLLNESFQNIMTRSFCIESFLVLLEHIEDQKTYRRLLSLYNEYMGGKYKKYTDKYYDPAKIIFTQDENKITKILYRNYVPLNAQNLNFMTCTKIVVDEYIDKINIMEHINVDRIYDKIVPEYLICEKIKRGYKLNARDYLFLLINNFISSIKLHNALNKNIDKYLFYECVYNLLFVCKYITVSNKLISKYVINRIIDLDNLIIFLLENEIKPYYLSRINKHSIYILEWIYEKCFNTDVSHQNLQKLLKKIYVSYHENFTLRKDSDENYVKVFNEAISNKQFDKIEYKNHENAQCIELLILLNILSNKIYNSNRTYKLVYKKEISQLNIFRIVNGTAGLPFSF